MPATRTRKRKTRLDDMSATHVLIIRDKVQDEEGDIASWLTPADFEPYYFVPEADEPDRGRNVAFWANASGGRAGCLAHLRSSDASLHRAFAAIIPPRWGIRAAHDFGWTPLPFFPYRMLWRFLHEFGIVDPDSYLKTAAHRMARADRSGLEGVCSCGPKDKPYYATSYARCMAEYIGRGYHCTAAAYQWVTEITGVAKRFALRGRVRDSEYRGLASEPCPQCGGLG